jgi:lipopolysaccharide/colanic/teichoic acid biosynthesis glycosyltransferase
LISRTETEGLLPVADRRSLDGEIAAPAAGDSSAQARQAPRGFYAISRRLLDIAGASIVLIVCAPLMLILAALIRLDSPGPAVFRQRRVGINRRRRNPATQPHDRRTAPGHGRPMMLCKFRSMYADARERFPELYSYEYTAEELHEIPLKLLVGVKPKSADLAAVMAARRYDPRITRVGAWLRRTSLDELPNFWNVLTGDMSLVGPRPDIEENVRYYSTRHLTKFDVKPGITGLSQISGRKMLSFHATNEYDVRYAVHCSPWLDLRILARTILVAIKGVGAF